jgi:anionic cell wall polymer biosynthesis LytR-Cps2A-Psr (LCP) family protein
MITVDSTRRPVALVRTRGTTDEGDFSRIRRESFKEKLL